MGTRHDLIEDIESEEEMPVLFMNGLPSNFQQNAELAAIATFMDSADEEADKDEDEKVDNGYGKQRRQRHDTSMKTLRRQPYGKLTLMDRSKKRRDKSKDSDTNELQLFLSMFTIN